MWRFHKLHLVPISASSHTKTLNFRLSKPTVSLFQKNGFSVIGSPSTSRISRTTRRTPDCSLLKITRSNNNILSNGYVGKTSWLKRRTFRSSCLCQDSEKDNGTNINETNNRKEYVENELKKYMDKMSKDFPDLVDENEEIDDPEGDYEKLLETIPESERENLRPRTHEELENMIEDPESIDLRPWEEELYNEFEEAVDMLEEKDEEVDEEDEEEGEHFDAEEFFGLVPDEEDEEDYGEDGEYVPKKYRHIFDDPKKAAMQSVEKVRRRKSEFEEPTFVPFYVEAINKGMSGEKLRKLINEKLPKPSDKFRFLRKKVEERAASQRVINRRGSNIPQFNLFSQDELEFLFGHPMPQINAVNPNFDDGKFDLDAVELEDPDLGFRSGNLLYNPKNIENEIVDERQAKVDEAISNIEGVESFDEYFARVKLAGEEKPEKKSEENEQDDGEFLEPDNDEEDELNKLQLEAHFPYTFSRDPETLKNIDMTSEDIDVKLKYPDRVNDIPFREGDRAASGQFFRQQWFREEMPVDFNRGWRHREERRRKFLEENFYLTHIHPDKIERCFDQADRKFWLTTMQTLPYDSIWSRKKVEEMKNERLTTFEENRQKFIKKMGEISDDTLENLMETSENIIDLHKNDPNVVRPEAFVKRLAMGRLTPEEIVADKELTSAAVAEDNKLYRAFISTFTKHTKVGRFLHIRITPSGKVPTRARFDVFGNRDGLVTFSLVKEYNIQKGKKAEIKIEKIAREAMKNVMYVPRSDGNRTIPHNVEGKHNGTKVMLFARPRGNGCKASALMQHILVNCVGVMDVTVKVIGNKNRKSQVLALFDAFTKLKSREWLAKSRGKVIYKYLDPADRHPRVPSREEVQKMSEEAEKLLETVRHRTQLMRWGIRKKADDDAIDKLKSGPQDDILDLLRTFTSNRS